jgi:hypothetical protein
MFTNATYLGHWLSSGYIVQWNNHPHIIEEATFFRAFNYLSHVTLTGDANPNYSPAQMRFNPAKQVKRCEEPPLLTGLVYSKIQDKDMPVRTHWFNGKEAYFYVLTTNDGLYEPVWRKKASYVDAAVSGLLLEKLKLTFSLDVWQTAIEEVYASYSEQKRLIESQLVHLKTVMENLVTSLSTLSNPIMIAAVEAKYNEASKEQGRLQKELAAIVSNTIDTQKLLDLKSMFSDTLTKWVEMNNDQKREVIHSYVDKIDATEVKDEVVEFVITWKDGSTDKLTVSRIAARGTTWLPQEKELLLKLVESGASKVEIAKAFPDLRWNVIYFKYHYMTGKSLVRETTNSIRKYETYNEYALRVKIGCTSMISETDWSRDSQH